MTCGRAVTPCPPAARLVDAEWRRPVRRRHPQGGRRDPVATALHSIHLPSAERTGHERTETIRGAGQNSVALWQKDIATRRVHDPKRLSLNPETVPRFSMCPGMQIEAGYACWLLLVGASCGDSNQANTNHPDICAPFRTQNIREHQESSENGHGEASD